MGFHNDIIFEVNVDISTDGSLWLGRGQHLLCEIWG